LSTIFDNHRQPPQYVEHDPAEEQRHCDAAGQPIKYLYASTPFPELRFARKPDDPHQRDAIKYLEDTNSSKYKAKKIAGNSKGSEENSHFSCSQADVDNLNKIGVTFL
jgi:hypothetical protein